MDMADLIVREQAGQPVEIIVRVAKRAGNVADIGEEIDARRSQQIDEFGDRPGRMADREQIAVWFDDGPRWRSRVAVLARPRTRGVAEGSKSSACHGLARPPQDIAQSRSHDQSGGRL
jgi:hypothetical protein